MRNTRSFLTHCIAITFLLLAGHVMAQPGGNRITTPGSTVSLQAPTGFTPLTNAEIALKFPRDRAPKYVVGNARRTTSIAYDLELNPIKEAELEKGLEVFESPMVRMIPNLVWKRKEIIEQASQRWIYLEMTSSAIDTFGPLPPSSPKNWRERHPT